MNYYLGIDIGTSGTKVLLIDETGLPVATATHEYPLSTPRPLWAEQEPADWWAAVVAGVQDVLRTSKVASAAIGGIGLSGQMHGSVFLDADNQVIRPALLWCDQRTQAQCDWLTAEVGIDNLVEYISNPVLTGFTAPKIIWLRENEPDAYRRVAKVLLPKDYIRLKLTGEFATEVSDASGTALFDVRNRRWSREVLAAAKIPYEWMADCAESAEVTASVSSAAAALTGLTAGTPVVGGGGDQAAGAVGAGVVETGIVSSTIGTSGVVFAYADAPATDPKLRIHTFCHAVPGKWHVMGVHLSSGGSLRWLRDTLYAGESYDAINREAASSPVGSEGLIFLPYLTGERTPYPDPYARGSFFGLTLRHARGHFARSVMEGVSYSLRDSFEIFKELGVEIGQVRASGGGAKSPLWRQINADVMRAEHVTLSIDEGPALGVALLAAVGTGVYATVADACRAAIRVTDRVAPQSKNADVYDKFYPVYRGLYPALKESFRAVSRAVGEE
ncbi:MAG: xylulokinase [Capsulimonadaceae bacterium]|nr:xylulokinase [Capsulimonadaceae bacterium]